MVTTTKPAAVLITLSTKKSTTAAAAAAMTQRATTITILFSLPLYKVFLLLFVFIYILVFGICKKHTKYKTYKNVCRNLLNKIKK